MKYRLKYSSISVLLLMFVVALLPAGVSAQPQEANEASGAVQQDQDCPPGEAECADDESGNGVDFGLSEMVNADFLTEEWQERIQKYLEVYDLSASFVGQAAASLIVLVLALILVYVGKKFIGKALGKLRASKVGFQISRKRMQFYKRCAGIFFALVLSCLVAITLVMIWSAQADEKLLYQIATSGFRLVLTFAFLFFLASAAFEVISAVMEFYFTKWSHAGSARVDTLLPIARNVANCTLFVLFGITLISELGINIMPLLAGAGVIGFAVGFGAQTIIKDLITGFIIIFEDLVQVGDVIVVGGKGGLVEKITIRKIQLRGLDGVVYTVPYSEISVIENMTKEFSYYLFNVGVAYRESPDEVIEVLKSIGEEMQEDEKYKANILAPLEVLGVDSFADSAVIIKARIKTLPIKQWEVGREFNRRMKYRFDELGIEIPFPHQTLYFGENKQGDAPAAKVELKKTPSAANDGADAAR